VRDCMEEAGATTQERPDFARLFPYAAALGGTDRVESYPELEGASVYAVAYGDAEALLFVGEDDEDARRFERTLAELGADGSSPRRSGRVLLVWAAPLDPSSAAALEACL
jgi:hypothetical protein